MTIALASKPGLSSNTTLHIPKDWDPVWFRNLISNQLKGADVRNAVGANGISITGTIASPYATISYGPGPVVLSTAPGTVALTVNGATSEPAVVINAGSGGSGLTVNGDILTTGGIQVTGYGIVGFAGQGIELGFTSGTGYLQAYDRTGSAYLPMQITGSSVAINISGATGTSFTISTNATYATLTNSSAGYTSSYGGVAGLQINNASATMQSALDFGLNGVLVGRLRCDHVGNLNHVATATGVHNFLVGGDVGTGGIVGLVNATGFATAIATYLMQSTVTQANGAGSGAGTLTNAPAAGNPTKWFAVNDNGTVRHIPAW